MLVMGCGSSKADVKVYKAARSVHLWFQTQESTDAPMAAYYNECVVRKHTPGSFFMACGFDGGYFGVQDNDGQYYARRTHTHIHTARIATQRNQNVLSLPH